MWDLNRVPIWNVNHILLVLLEGKVEGVLVPVQALHEESFRALELDRVLLVRDIARFLHG